MKETIHFQRVDRLCNAGACARGFSDSASIKGYIMIHQSDEFPSTDPSVHPCHVWSLCIQASCGCPHCLHNTLACSQVCLRRDPLQMESSRRVVSWDGAIYWRLSTGTWLGASGCWESNWFSSPEKVVGSSKATPEEGEAEDWAPPTHAQGPAIFVWAWGRAVWKRGVPSKFHPGQIWHTLAIYSSWGQAFDAISLWPKA